MISIFCLAVALLNFSGQEPEENIEEFLQRLPQASEKEARDFIESTQAIASTQPNEEKKCPCSSQVLEIATSQNFSEHKLLLFTSFSVPVESWKEHSRFLERAGGVFVLRGLPENSFTDLSQKILELRKAGIQAEIILDPPSFEKYGVEAVPSLVVDNGKLYDKASGNSKIPAVLSLFSDSGDAKDAAMYFLQRGGA